VSARSNFSIRQAAAGPHAYSRSGYVQNQHHEPCTTYPLGPFEHFLVAARISERGAGPLPMNKLIAMALPVKVVNEKHVCLAQHFWFAVLILIPGQGTDPITCSGGIRYTARCIRMCESLPLKLTVAGWSARNFVFARLKSPPPRRNGFRDYSTPCPKVQAPSPQHGTKCHFLDGVTGSISAQ
jgi:hypothetical protein